MIVFGHYKRQHFEITINRGPTFQGFHLLAVSWSSGILRKAVLLLLCKRSVLSTMSYKCCYCYFASWASYLRQRTDAAAFTLQAARAIYDGVQMMLLLPCKLNTLSAKVYRMMLLLHCRLSATARRWSCCYLASSAGYMRRRTEYTAVTMQAKRALCDGVQMILLLPCKLSGLPAMAYRWCCCAW